MSSTTSKISIATLIPADFPDAGSLFREGFLRLCKQVPELPARILEESVLKEKLERLSQSHTISGAFEGEKLVGYLGAFFIDDFRDTGRKAAFSPEWAHAVQKGAEARINNLLYREAAALWGSQGCTMHAITLLAGNAVEEKVWFWNSFGMIVVDALRSTQTLNASLPEGFSIRQASPDDAAAICELEAEHCQHYSAPPVCMPPRSVSTTEEMGEFLTRSPNSIYLAWHGDHPAAYIQFEKTTFGGASVIQAEDSIAITGAYTRPTFRGRNLAASLLDEGLKAYAERGFTRCSVDFESMNPEAASFWMRYFKPVCFSLVRYPENTA
jgi:ribosomal protein S18 acetylase RimI-like enzyme